MPWLREGTGTPGDGPAQSATVVIGIDGSSASWAAFRWSCGEARQLGGRVVAVLTSPGTGGVAAGTCATAGLTAVGYLVPDLTDRQRVTEDLAVQMRREAADLDLAFVHAPGNPLAALLRAAGQVHADLIVIGRPAATPRRLAGSAARRRDPVIIIIPAQPESRLARLQV